MALPSLDDVSEDEIEKLAASAGGLDLSHAVRRQFLTDMANRDVQAAPGAGKTTLLGLKLRLIGRRRQPGMGGIAVVTHTNVAKREIEAQVQKHPEADCLLRYPHFIGTLTQFAHQFLAVPTCRGLGYEIQTVDKDTFIAAAVKALMETESARGWLAGRSGLSQHVPFKVRLRAGAQKIAQVLTLNGDNPRSLAPLDGLGVDTPTFAALRAVKAALVARGLFSYADMMAVANHALKNIPDLPQALAARFPMLVLDEAQDTSTEQFDMLHTIRDAGAVLQCIGDVNQAIMAEGATPAWTIGTQMLDLDESKRFGPAVATVASRLGVYRPQNVVSSRSPDSLLHAILFADGAEHLVPTEYAKIIAGTIGPVGDFWAVGHRRTANEAAQNEQLVIGSYFPGFGPAAESAGPTLHQAIVQFGRSGCGPDVVGGAIRSIIRHCCELTEEQQKALSYGRLLRALNRHYPEVAAAVRGWIAANLETPPLSEAQWQGAQTALLPALGPLGLVTARANDCYQLGYAADFSPIEKASDGGARVVIDVAGTRIPIQVGTIASIKGQTHDATLILQTSFGNMKPLGKFADALKATTAKNWGPKERTLLANFYVAATRPRKLLAIAGEASQINDQHRNLMQMAGWTIVEVQAPTASASAAR